jgi:hypothetical protein|tara:strand:+ start:88 stop:315 length:228 start_codon:yes stop_codon:yes gene_type:complete
MNTESKDFKRKINVVKDIGNKDLTNKIRGNAKDNMQGAIIGGVLGLIGSVALRKKPIYGILIGAIAGRLLITKTK